MVSGPNSFCWHEPSLFHPAAWKTPEFLLEEVFSKLGAATEFPPTPRRFLNEKTKIQQIRTKSIGTQETISTPHSWDLCNIGFTVTSFSSSKGVNICFSVLTETQLFKRINQKAAFNAINMIGLIQRTLSG